jgi:hypothetical protein
LPLRKQQARLYRQIQGLHSVAHFWLRQHVFPAPGTPGTPGRPEIDDLSDLSFSHLFPPKNGIWNTIMSTPDFAKPWFMKILGVPSK